MNTKENFVNYRNMVNLALNTIDLDQLELFENQILDFASSGTILFTAGNGGSAAIAEHFTCDHAKGVSEDTNLSPFVIPLASNVSTLTAVANDYDYSEVFSKYINWLHEDIPFGLLLISSSGNSENVVKAAKAAKNRGTVLALTGFDGGQLKKIADICVHVDFNNYGVVEDVHQMIMHMVAQKIRKSHKKKGLIPAL